MKHTRNTLLFLLMLGGVQLAWTGCVGYVGGGDGGAYGNVWFHDDVWVDGGGRGWYGGHGGYVHPGGHDRR